jgi:MSHA biogenesis protein MshN
MSVINQMLNQLEQRGAHTASGQSQVRAVPKGKRSIAKPLLASGLALLIMAVAWQWQSERKPAIAPESTASRAVSGRVVAGEGAAPAVPVSAVPDERPMPETAAPASRLSFELSSVPLPSSPRSEKNTGAIKPSRAEPEPRKPQQVQAVAPPAAPFPAAGLPMKRVSKAQQAAAEFRRAVELMQQGRIGDAIEGYETALSLDTGHQAARQALVALLLEAKRSADAERVLQEGLDANPEQTGFAMLLARLQVESGAVEKAMSTLEKCLPYADNQADYQAFFAALLQRQNRHKEAITHYQIALQLAPNNGIWLMGYGISLQGVQRNDDARDAFRRAIESQTLSPELRGFVQQRLKAL